MRRTVIFGLAAASLAAGLAGCATDGTGAPGAGILGGITGADVEKYVGIYCGLQPPIDELATLANASVGETAAQIGQIVCSTYNSVVASTPPPAGARLGAKLGRTIKVDGVSIELSPTS